MNILQIKSSLFGDDGQSSRLANEFVAALLERNPGAGLVLRDVVRNPLPHLDLANMGAHSAVPTEELRRADVTFRYTEKGPEGLLKGKKAYIFAARGGEYAASGNDWQAQFVRVILGFIGVSEVQFVFAEGLKISEARKEASLAAARSALRNLVPQSRHAVPQYRHAA